MKFCLVAAIIIAATAPVFAGPKEELIAVDRAFARMSVQKGYDQAYIANLARGPIPSSDLRPCGYLAAGFSATMLIWPSAASSAGSAVAPAGNWLKDRI
jgi:hypothetical protein